ncbi:MAG TPA: ABC transporter permease [Candidatus Limnocylindrales bacterium]|nr:ABC transporter permease [Candidatus Limnocylindrales bacterium]
MKDLRYGVRTLRRSPGFCLAAILTLALGIGANTVMFSVLDSVLLQPLPYKHPDRLVQLYDTNTSRQAMQGPVSVYDLLDWQAQSRSFNHLATFEYESMALSGEGDPQRVAALFVTPDFFNVFEAAPLMGRAFLPADSVPGKDHLVVISYRAWRRFFNQDAHIVGRAITLDDEPYTVIGVMPVEFAFPAAGTQFWCLRAYKLDKFGRASHFLQAVGSLKSGVTLREAQSEMDTIAERIAVQYPETNRGMGVRLVGLQDTVVGRYRTRLLVLWGAVVAVLIIASANVAGLLLARAISRQKEIAVRIALGGSRGRLIRQFMTESMLLSVAGTGMGLLLAALAGRALILASDGAVPRLTGFHLNLKVLAFTAVCGLFTAVLFGLAPAFHAVRRSMNLSLKEGGTSSTNISDRLQLRSFLVSSELALCLVLLVSAGLLIRTLWRLEHVDPGFQTENILTFRISVPPAKYSDQQRRTELYKHMLENVAAIPGVESVGATNDLPFAGSRSGTSFQIEGQTLPPGQTLHTDYRIVSPDYMRTMGMKLLRGREFSEHDNRETQAVAVLNGALVQRYFGGQDPLGKYIHISGQDIKYQVVGVIGNIKHQDLAAETYPEIYVSYLQAGPRMWTFVALRSRVEWSSLSKAVRHTVAEAVPGQPLYDMQAMADRVGYSVSGQRFTSLLLAIFAGLALVLSSIGIYGVMAHSVGQRTHEIGVRMALGADRSHVLKLIIRQAARIAIVGLSAGVLGAFLTTRVLNSMLFGVSSYDPFTFSAVGLVLALVVMGAAYLPARRATLVDPVVALRCE